MATTEVDPGAPTGREQSTPTSIRLPNSVLEQIDAMADFRSISRNQLLTRVVENMLKIRKLGIVPNESGDLVKLQKACDHQGAVRDGICGFCGTGI